VTARTRPVACTPPRRRPLSFPFFAAVTPELTAEQRLAQFIALPPSVQTDAWDALRTRLEPMERGWL
jgi:hypothetical protein